MEQIHTPYMTKKLLPDLDPSYLSDLSPATQMCQAYSLLRQLHFLFLCLECSTSKFSRTASLPFRSQCKCCLLSRAFSRKLFAKAKVTISNMSSYFILHSSYSLYGIIFLMCLLTVCPSSETRDFIDLIHSSFLSTQ